MKEKLAKLYLKISDSWPMIKKKLLKLGYWLLMLTWGLPFTIVGFLASFVLRCFGCPNYKNGFGMITTVGGNWGGLSIGPFAFCGRYEDKTSKCYSHSWYEYTRCHEFGHSLQILFMGPFWLFIVAIPSAIRYWYFRIKNPNKDYYSIWFEKTASSWGLKAISYIEEDNKKA